MHSFIHFQGFCSAKQANKTLSDTNIYSFSFDKRLSKMSITFSSVGDDLNEAA